MVLIMPLSDRILEKIGNYLLAKEGCIIENRTYDSLTIRDSFGFVYYLKLDAIGRVQVETLEKEAV